MAYLDKVRINNTDYQLVGTGEMLPVGTELDIDKNATIPTGWEEIEYDTGWVDIPIDTTKCSIKTGGSGANKNTQFKPQIRRIGNSVFMRGTLNITKSLMTAGSMNKLSSAAIDSKFLSNSNEVQIVDFPDTYNVYISSMVRTDTNKGYLCLYTNTGWASFDKNSFSLQLDTSWTVDDLPTKRIKKVSETQVPSIGEVYDDQERVIGTWFGKPLYRKVFTTNNSTIDTSSLSVEHYVKIYGFCIRADGEEMPIPKSYPDITWNICVNQTTFTTVGITVGSGYTDNLSVTDYTIIIEYTKTTD